MTKEEIIRLMHEAAKDHSEYYAGCGDPKGEDMEVFVKFAELVAQREREACARMCEEEICACCWEEGAQDVAEHLAERIRQRSRHDPHPPL